MEGRAPVDNSLTREGECRVLGPVVEATSWGRPGRHPTPPPDSPYLPYLPRTPVLVAPSRIVPARPPTTRAATEGREPTTVAYCSRTSR